MGNVSEGGRWSKQQRERGWSVGERHALMMRPLGTEAHGAVVGERCGGHQGKKWTEGARGSLRVGRTARRAGEVPRSAVVEGKHGR